MDNSSKQKIKFMVGAKVLRAKLKAASRVVGPGLIPILENFLFDISGSVLTVTSSDMETTICTTIDISNAEGSGSIAVPAKRLMELLGVCGDSSLSFTISGTTVKINTGSGTYSVECMPGNEFPDTSEVTGSSFTMGSEDMLSGLSKTQFCAKTDELRPILSGICMSVSSNEVRFAATDMFKMSECVVPAVADVDAQIVIPVKAVKNIISMLEGRTDDVAVSFNDKNILFSLPGTFISCLRTEGTYPKYRGILDMDLPFKIEVDLPSLLEVTKRISVVSPATSRITTIKFNSDNSLVLSSRDVDFGVSGEEKLVCKSGIDCSVSIKVDFLLEVLSHLSGDVVTVAMKDEKTACSLYVDDKHKTLLMPMVI